MIKSVKLLARLANSVKESASLLPVVVKDINKESNRIFVKHALLANLSISICFSGLGDFVEQLLEISRAVEPTDWNKTRTLKFATTGLTVGLVCHYWYYFLDKRFAESNKINMVKKIFLCQLVHSPICIFVFFMTLGFLNNWNRSEILKNTLEKGRKLYQAEWMIWPPALVFSFYFLSTRYRVLYDSLISLGFDVYNSFIVHNEPAITSKKNQENNFLMSKK